MNLLEVLATGELFKSPRYHSTFEGVHQGVLGAGTPGDAPSLIFTCYKRCDPRDYKEYNSITRDKAKFIPVLLVDLEADDFYVYEPYKEYRDSDLKEAFNLTLSAHEELDPCQSLSDLFIEFVRKVSRANKEK